jgi:hypothetical protein
LAFLILKPASWFLSPRALHSANVFLIKLTSLPQLIVIAIYERHLKSSQKIRQSSKEAAASLFNSLPRHIKNMPLLEALLGSSHNDIYDAILHMEMDEDYDIFAEFEADEGHLRSSRIQSRSNSITGDSNHAQSTGAGFSQPSSATSPTKRRIRTLSTPWASSRGGAGRGIPHSRVQTVFPVQTPDRKLAAEGYGSMANDTMLQPEPEDVLPPRIVTSMTSGPGNSGMMSPLARFFNNRSGWVPNSAEQTVIAVSAETNASTKRVETLLTEVKALPVNQLRDEMRELQVSSFLP